MMENNVDTNDSSISCSTAMNRADAVRRQSIEVVQLARSDVEELHAKLKSLQETPESAEDRRECDDPVRLLDNLLSFVQREKEQGAHNKAGSKVDSGFTNKLSLLVSLCGPAATLDRGDIGESTRNGVSSGATGRDQNANTASSSVQQCSAITDRFEDKINKQQETIERLNNALEEVELILEESHAKNATLQEQLTQMEEENRKLRDARKASNDEVKEPSSSTDVTTTSESLTALDQLRGELEQLRRERELAKQNESELAAKCADFSHQIENLTSQLAESQGASGQGADSQAKLESLKRENQNLMLELSEVQHNLNRVAGENERLKAAVKDTSLGLPQEDPSESLKKELQEAQKALEKAKGEMAVALHERDDERKVVEDVRAQNMQLQHELEEATRSASEVKETLAAQKALVESVEQKNVDHEKQNEQLRKEIKNLEEKLEALEEENSTLKNQESLAPPSLEVEILLEELKADLASSRSALDERSKELAARDERVTELEALLAETQGHSSIQQQQTSEQLKELTDEIEELKKQQDQAVAELNQKLREELKDKQKAVDKLEELKTDLDAKSSELESTTRELETTKAKAAKVEAALEAAEKRCEKAETEMARIVKAEQSVNEAHDSLQAELRLSTAKLEEAEKRASQAETAKEETRAKLLHATEENGRIMQELKTMEEEKTSLHVDLVKCRQQLCDTTQVKATLEKLRSENAELKTVADRARKDTERLKAESEEASKATERATADAAKARQEAVAGQEAASRDREALMSEIAALSEKHLKVNSELESVRCESKAKLELIGQMNTQMAALKAQNGTLVQRAKEATHDKDSLELQMSALKTELSAKAIQTEKLSKDLRSQMAHNDNLKKQVSTLVMAVADKEKHIANLHSENQKLRSENQIYNEKQKGQDALINRIASLEQDVVNSKITISKVCAEREESLRLLDEFKKKHSSLVKEAESKAIRAVAEQKSIQEKFSRSQDEFENLKKRHDIALSERTIAESRCRATLNMSRRLEKELSGLQKDKEKLAKEATEAQDHIKFLERERGELLKALGELPLMSQSLQLENDTLRAENARLKERTGRKNGPENTKGAPPPKRKSIFGRNDKAEEESPVKIEAIEENQPPARRRGVRRSASDAELPAPKKGAGEPASKITPVKKETPKVRSKGSSSTEEEVAPVRRRSTKSSPTPPKNRLLTPPKDRRSEVKGRRSLIKGTPKKSPSVAAASSPSSGRSLRASTLVVKKASDSDAKQREQFKKRPSLPGGPA